MAVAGISKALLNLASKKAKDYIKKIQVNPILIFLKIYKRILILILLD